MDKVEYGWLEVKKEMSDEFKIFLKQMEVVWDASETEDGYIHFRIYQYTEAEEEAIDRKVDELWKKYTSK